MDLIDNDVEPRGRRAIKQLKLDGCCAAVRYTRESDSTNNLALDYLRSGQWTDGDDAALFLTDHQTGGRGRHGRRWESKDDTLTFSLVLASCDLTSSAGQMTGLAVGVAVANAIEFELAPLKTRLKWPNDVYVDGGKAAGILLETVAGIPKAVVVGVGINVGSRPELRDDPNGSAVRDLSSSAGRKLHRYDLLPAVVEQIVDAIASLEDNLDELLVGFRQRCLLNQQNVTFLIGGTSGQGLCRGIGPHGELLIETDEGLRRLTSGEAHRVRIR
ncbi:MAG: biotin--[acetyl-CoA-carboxylase] ligase [Rubripirellula sp.]|nr:biotin--[acetyl-CoA-carboxylase] ligase [Rubripirellula sp.]